MLRLVVAAWMALAIGSAIADEPTSADQAQAAPEKKEEYVPPRGYKPKKFGDKTLYCRSDREIGTRFKTEKCYDEETLTELELIREQNQRNMEQRRAICSDPTICAPT